MELMELAGIKEEMKSLRDQTQKECKKIYIDAKEKTSRLREVANKKIAELKLKEAELKKNKQAKDSFLHTRIDKELSEKLKTKAEKLGVSASDYIRDLIETSLKK